MKTILIVEDEVKLAQLQIDYLQNAGFTTHHLINGLDVAPWLKTNQADLILLDLMLPGCDGILVCKEIRDFSTILIIMVTARIEEIDRLIGLEVGADDYICKPFSLREMVSRVKAIVRRLEPQPQMIINNDITLEPNYLKVIIGGNEIELSAVEFNLMQAMHKQPGRIFSRSKLMDLIYSDDRIVSDRTIDSHVKKLRKKLMEISPHQELIHSIYGAGYRYDPQLKTSLK